MMRQENFISQVKNEYFSISSDSRVRRIACHMESAGKKIGHDSFFLRRYLHDSMSAVDTYTILDPGEIYCAAGIILDLYYGISFE